MEHNENNIQEQMKKERKVNVPLIGIMLIVLLFTGIGGGYLLSKNTDIFKRIETQKDQVISTNNLASSASTTAEDSQKYIGKWIDKEHVGELNIFSIENGHCSISCDIYRLVSMDRTSVSIENNKGTFYFRGWDDKNFNSIPEEGEMYYRKATMTLEEDLITIKVEDVKFADYDIKYETEFAGQVYFTGTYNFKLKKNGTKSNNNETQANEVDNKYKQEYLKIINEVSSKYPNEQLKYDLIYFNNDNIPDLVISNTGYWVSVYMYENGTVYNPVDSWSYGTMGNVGYNYQDKKSVILNYSSDYAGAIRNKNISILNSAHEFDRLSYTAKEESIIKESNLPEAVLKDVDKAIQSYGGYYYNSQKISEQEYNSKLQALSINIDYDNSKELTGTKSVEEVKKQLQ